MLRRLRNQDLNLSYSPGGARQPSRLDSRIEVHHNNQVELKLDYTIDTRARRTRYQVEAFFFVPKSLVIGNQSYDKDRFYSDTQAYIRFKTPHVPLCMLVDPSHQASPLHRIDALFKAPSGCADQQPHGELSQEIRMLGCVIRSNLREATLAISEQLDQLDLPHENRAQRQQAVHDVITVLADQLDAACLVFRELHGYLPQVRQPDWLRETMQHADEYISVTVESYLTSLLVDLDKHGLREAMKDSWQRLTETIGHEQAYRAQAGYPATLDGEDGRDNFVARCGALKKFITSVLFLTVSPRNEGNGIIQFAAAVAAAAAMTFSTIAAILSERVWGINSLSFVLAVVIAYVFKDRIKDWIKLFFSARFARWIPDRSQVVVDPESDLCVGRCRESFSFLDHSRVPHIVSEYRSLGVDERLSMDYVPEVVLHYVKNVALRGRRIGNVHGRRRAINDIIRWNLSSFLARMDDPQRVVEVLDHQSRQLHAVSCPKRYELNVVLMLKAEDRVDSIQRFRILLDRDGIHALELLQPETASEPPRSGVPQD